MSINPTTDKALLEEIQALCEKFQVRFLWLLYLWDRTHPAELLFQPAEASEWDSSDTRRFAAALERLFQTTVELVLAPEDDPLGGNAASAAQLLFPIVEEPVDTRDRRFILSMKSRTADTMSTARLFASYDPNGDEITAERARTAWIAAGRLSTTLEHIADQYSAQNQADLVDTTRRLDALWFAFSARVAAQRQREREAADSSDAALGPSEGSGPWPGSSSADNVSSSPAANNH